MPNKINDHPIKYPIDEKNGYYARNATERRFDTMLREHAKATSKDAMYDFLAFQHERNSLRRIEDTLDYITERLAAIEDMLNRP